MAEGIILFALLYFAAFTVSSTSLALSSPSLTLSSKHLILSFKRVQNLTHSAHILPLNINQYSYLIDITIHPQQDYFLNLNDAYLTKSISAPDYRKT
jgi:hypothetical protein